MEKFSKINKLKLSKELIELRRYYKSIGIPSALEETLNELILHCSIKSPQTILEIGTATGISGIAMLSYLPNANLTTIEKDEQSFYEAKKNFAKFGIENNVKQLLGDAGDILNYLNGSFDFIFLDGAKARYIDYYYDIKRLLKPNGVLFADNVLFRGYVDGEVEFDHRDNTIVRNMREFLHKVIDDEDYICSIYEIGDGILIAQKL